MHNDERGVCENSIYTQHVWVQSLCGLSHINTHRYCVMSDMLDNDCEVDLYVFLSLHMNSSSMAHTRWSN